MEYYGQLSGLRFCQTFSEGNGEQVRHVGTGVQTDCDAGNEKWNKPQDDYEQKIFTAELLIDFPFIVICAE